MALSIRGSLKFVALSAVAGLALSGCSSTSEEPAAASGKTATVSSPTIIKDGTLSVCVGSTTPPTAFLEDDGTNVGAEIDLSEALASELGLTPEYSEYAFPGRIPALQAKQCDVIISSIYIKPEREEVVDFVPYLASGSGVAVSNENPQKITGFDNSLCGKKVLTITGATATADAEQLSKDCVASGEKALDLSYTDQSTNAFQQVTAGQVDAYTTAADIIGYYEMLSNGEFKSVGDTFGVVEIGAATLKGNDELHTALQAAFDSVVESGKYAEILKEWGLSNQDITKM